MKKNLKIFIIAGEVSGDTLGAKIMREMPGVQFAGIGGSDMKSAGLKSLFPISDLAVMGIFEVVARAGTLLRRIDETVRAIEKFQPDIVLTIDSPSFAKRVIERIKKNSDKTSMCPLFYHVVAPQVWAWGAKRAKKFAKLFDRLYCFFDFEVPYFTRYGLPTIAVGHPIADGLKIIPENDNPKNKIITLIPGSRMSEVKKLLPIFKQVAEQLSEQKNQNFKFALPVVETTKDYILCEIKNWPVKPDIVSYKDRYDLYAKTFITIAASGTVTAEMAIMHIPTVVVYKMNRFTMMLARILVKIKWVSLVNILLKKTVFPELLGTNATTENILRSTKKLSLPAARHSMISDLTCADKLWRPKNKNAAKLIATDIKVQSEE